MRTRLFDVVRRDDTMVVRCVLLLIVGVTLLANGCNRQEPSSEAADIDAGLAEPGLDNVDPPAGFLRDPGPPGEPPSTVSRTDEQTEPATVEAGAQAKPAAGKTRRANRLARETSPYLLLHAHNPVDWYPWGPEAFEAAKQQDKPIFLSVGYSSCYWCHVMERLVFENDEIAAFMNEHFINIKVDREERPDVDDIYMVALQVYLQLSDSGGGGGWPMSMFLTPAGKPIAGATYLPPEDMPGRPGFPGIMKRVAEVFAERRADVEQGAEAITEIVKREMLPGLSLEAVEPSRELVESVSRSLIQSHDPDFGGIDFDHDSPDSPKFPVPTKLALLQYDISVQRSEAARGVLYHTLDAMAAGGIRDHLGGGFHRYSTDREWLVPHFEKMLYDNAQLAAVYTEAFRETQNPEYQEVAEEILQFVLNEMTDAGGAFHSAIDAETDGVEGLYYVWSKEEVEGVLGLDAPLFMRAYGMTEESPFEHGYVLHLPRAIDQLAADERILPRDLRLKLYDQRRRLLDARRKRESPLKDDKIITSWNGLMIGAMARGGIIFGRQQYVDAAERAMMFVLTKMRDSDGRLLRTYRSGTAKLNAYVDDYSFLIEALLTLQWATRHPDNKWLNAARRLTDDQLRMFRDEKGGGMFFTAHHHEELLARTKNGWDSVLPSGNSVAVRNLIRIASLTGADQYRGHAKEILDLFAPQMKRNPQGTSNMALAMGEFLDETDFRPLLERVKETPRPNVPGRPNPRNADPRNSDPGNSDPGNAATGQSPPGSAAIGRGNRSTAVAGEQAGLSPFRFPDEVAPDSPIAGASATASPQGAGGSPVQAAVGETSAPKASKKPPRVQERAAYLSTNMLPAGRRCQFAVTLEIAPGWHINTNPSNPKFLIPTEMTLKSELGVMLENVHYPAGMKLKVHGSDDVYHVYDRTVTLIGDLVVPDSVAGQTDRLTFTIRYQACNEETCERPQTLQLEASVKVSQLNEEPRQINGAVFRAGTPPQ
jgi:uncharacterized protein